ncbi:unnamed protein product, partial [Mesorhabditis belari]|uniref:Uncharacterized protein n=1 Tax=Mesorhabditis belari TaxID=2138241 RepID=A0AAF3EVV4_9BILA
MKRSIFRYLFCIRNELPTKVSEEKAHPPPSLTVKHDHLYCSMALRQPKQQRESKKSLSKQIDNIYVVNEYQKKPINAISTKVPLKLDASTQTESLNPCTLKGLNISDLKGKMQQQSLPGEQLLEVPAKKQQNNDEKEIEFGARLRNLLPKPFRQDRLDKAAKRAKTKDERSGYNDHLLKHGDDVAPTSKSYLYPHQHRSCAWEERKKKRRSRTRRNEMLTGASLFDL